MSEIGKDEKKLIALIIGGLAVVALALILAIPFANIFRKKMVGIGMLAEAEYSKKVLIEEAKARKDSAVFDAEAEIARAKGVAEANRIIGDSLKGNESYLRYLWITSLDQNGQVIYVPTEANLPILEAGKR